MTNRQIIDLKVGHLIVRNRRVKLPEIWIVAEQIDNAMYAIVVDSPTEFRRVEDWRRGRRPDQRAWRTLTWRNLRDYRRIA